MEHAFTRAREGGGRLIAIAAEAGAGKTALTERFVSAHAKDARLYWGACENLSTPEVLLPLRDIARASGESLDFGADHIRAFEALLRLLSRDARPAILIIEDVHWADTATLDLIRFLARRIARAGAVVLITYREEEVDTRSPVRNLLGEAPSGNVERLTLAPLSLAAVTRLAAKRGRRGEELFALTAGNAFLVTEALAVEGDVPTDAVRDATLARASRLSESARAVLDAVSIFPRHAETAVVADLVKGAIDAGLDQCVEKGMLSLEGGLVQFRHELARRAVETSIAPGRRAAFHQRVIDVLMRRSDARASQIAHHAERAGDIAALLEFAHRAAEEAARAGAPREAAAHFATMLRHRDSLSSDLLLEALEKCSQQAYLMGDPDIAMISMTEAAELRRRAKDILGLGRDLTRLTRFAWMCGRRADAERFVAESIAVLETAPPGPELAWAYSHQSQLDMLDWRMDRAVAWGERALDLATQLNEKEIIIHALGNIGSAKVDGVHGVELEKSFDLAVAGKYHDHVERACCNLACMCYWRRDYQSALKHIDRGVSYAVALELRHWEAYLRGWRSMVLLDQGDWTAAEDEALEICRRTNVADMYRFPALIALARLRVRRGDPDADIPLAAARHFAAGAVELQRSIYVAIIVAEKAWLLMSTEDDEAKRMLIEVKVRAKERNTSWITEDAALWLSLLNDRAPGLEATGEPAGEISKLSSPFREHCAGRWQEAAEGWRALGRPYEEALALSGGDDVAQRAALEILDRLGAMPAAARLRRQMRAGGSRAIPRGPIAMTRANAAGLTRRQVEVLGLLGEALSNAEIAARLCISAKTAEHHVSAIMARLEVSSRQEAAAAARDRGLLAELKK